MWCPSASLTVWVNAWLAGRAAPDDVLDALSLWAPSHSVTAYDSVAAGLTGLPWPDLDDGGVMALLQTLRTGAGTGNDSMMRVLLPVPGDVRGLPAGSVFARDAILAGEAMVVTGVGGTVGVVPECPTDDDVDDPGSDSADSPRGLAWTVYSLPTGRTAEHLDLGESEHALRTAVRCAAEVLGRLPAVDTGTGCSDPRGMVAALRESTGAHPVPAHAPDRALRVLDAAAHVEAIITVGADRMPIAAQSSSEFRLAGEALRPLSAVVRTARLAAVSAIVDSAWR